MRLYLSSLVIKRAVETTWARHRRDRGQPPGRGARRGAPNTQRVYSPGQWDQRVHPISVHSKRFALLHSKYLVHRKSHAEQRVAIALSPEISQFHGFVASIKGAAPSSLIIVRA